MSIKNPYTIPNGNMISHKRLPKQARTQRVVDNLRDRLRPKRALAPVMEFLAGEKLVKATDLLREAAKRNRETEEACHGL